LPESWSCRDLADAFLAADAVGELEGRPGQQLDLDGLVHVEDRAVLLQPVLVQARQEGEFVARRGRIEDRLRIFAGFDPMLGGDERNRDEQRKESGGHASLRGGQPTIAL